MLTHVSACAAHRNFHKRLLVLFNRLPDVFDGRVSLSTQSYIWERDFFCSCKYIVKRMKMVKMFQAERGLLMIWNKEKGCCATRVPEFLC